MDLNKFIVLLGECPAELTITEKVLLAVLLQRCYADGVGCMPVIQGVDTSNPVFHACNECIKNPTEPEYVGDFTYAVMQAEGHLRGMNVLGLRGLAYNYCCTVLSPESKEYRTLVEKAAWCLKMAGMR